MSLYRTLLPAATNLVPKSDSSFCFQTAVAFSYCFSNFAVIGFLFPPYSICLFPVSDPGNQFCHRAELGLTGGVRWRRQHRHHAWQLLRYCGICVSMVFLCAFIVSLVFNLCNLRYQKTEKDLALKHHTGHFAHFAL